jgi:hypothetical protein
MAISGLSDLQGQTLHNRYQIQQQLGKRAGRRSLLAQDLHTKELVVIKLLIFGEEFEWDDLKLFEREAETLQSLSHPAIPRYLNHFELDLLHRKGFALVQTYIPAKSLEAHLKAGRSFSEAEVKQLARALLEILIYLHDRQPPVIHRDLKPSNVLLTNRSGNSVGQVYLVDFGSVQTIAAKEGGTLTVVGTYGYMPPEQFGGRATPASDLYSLGATLIYLSSGKHPADLPQRDLRLQFESAVNLSPALVRWLKQMVEPSLDRRFAAASVALESLDQARIQPGQTAVAETATVSFKKPAGSRVKLTKSASGLEIVIPPEGFTLSAVGLTAGAIVSNLAIFFVLRLLLISAPLLGALFVAAAAFGVYLVCKALFALCGQVRLRLDPQHMILTYELFGAKYECTPVSIEHICKLQHTKKFFRLHQVRVSEKTYVEEPARLIIWAGTKEYEICNEHGLTNPEVGWLAQELSEWLGLEVDRD